MTFPTRTASLNSDCPTITITFDGNLSGMIPIPDGGVGTANPVFLMGNSDYLNGQSSFSWSANKPVIWMTAYDDAATFLFAGTEVYGASSTDWGIKQTGDPNDYGDPYDPWDQSLTHYSYVDGLLLANNINSTLSGDDVTIKIARTKVGALTGQDGNTPFALPTVETFSGLSFPNGGDDLLQHRLMWGKQAIGSTADNPQMLLMGPLSYVSASPLFGALKFGESGSPSIVGLFALDGGLDAVNVHAACNDGTYHYIMWRDSGSLSVAFTICQETAWPPSSYTNYFIQLDHPDITDFYAFFHGTNPNLYMTHIAGTDEGFLIGYKQDSVSKFILVSKDWTSYHEIEFVSSNATANQIILQGSGADYIDLTLADGTYYLLGGTNAAPLIATGTGSCGACLVSLADIMKHVSYKLGLAAADYDYSDLDQCVTGYSWTQAAGKDIVGRLLTLYDSDIRPNGFVLEGIKRGGADDDDAIGYDWFMRGNEGSPSHTITMASESDLTRRAFLTFADTGADQQPNTAVVQRSANSVLTRRETSLDLSNWASTSADAQQLLERVMRRFWIGSVTMKNGLPPHYLRMLPGGVRTFNLRDDLEFRGRLTRMSIGADRTIECSWEQDIATVNTTRDSPGGAANGMPPQQVYDPVDSLAFVLDIPLLADTHDQSTPFTYVGGAQAEDGDWPGVDIQMSESGSEDSYGAAWDGAASGEQTVWGTVEVTPGDVLTSVVDWGTGLVVLVSNGDLTSYTEDEILANQSLNQFIVGAQGRWMIGQFCTATIQSEGEYILEGIIWGARGTERHVGSVQAGDRFLLSTSNIHRHDMGASKISDPDWYKGVTLGASDTNEAPYPVTFSAAANRPYSPVNIELVKELSGDWTITWQRRTRIGGALLDGQDVPLGETSEAYKVRILEGISGGTVRTIETTSEEAVYTLAQQTADWGGEQFVLAVEIVQMSPMLGIEGFETVAYV